MSLTDLSRINLNLLVCLQVLLEERNVSRTAERLYVSQSAISKNLAQLRDVTGDPLFTRTSHGLTPTTYAEQLEVPLGEALENLWGIIQPRHFDPGTSERRFRIAMPESANELLLLNFLPNMLEDAPGIRLNSHMMDVRSLEWLAQGRLDLVILPQDLELQKSSHPGLNQQELYRDNFACLRRKGHPDENKDWNLEHYLDSSHVRVIIEHHSDTQNLVDQELSGMSKSRDVKVTVSDFYSATHLCERTKLIFTCSRAWAENATRRYAVESLPLPFETSDISYMMWWHRRSDNDAGHQWLRQTLLQAAKPLHKG